MFKIIATVVMLASGQTIYTWESKDHYASLVTCKQARKVYLLEAKKLIKEYYPQGGVKGSLKCVKV